MLYDQKDMVTIIIPVYNVERYIEQCIKSAINQTWDNVEIIVVDDGATDGSADICDHMADIDHRIRVVHQENGGLSEARNTGLDVMRGKWVFFLDGDDYISEKTIEKMVEIAQEENADIVTCDWHLVDEDYNGYYSEKFDKMIITKYNGPDFFSALILRGEGKSAACNKLYKACLFESIRFRKGKIHEDEFFINDLWSCVNNIVITDVKLYYYRQRSASIMAKCDNEKPLRDAIEALTERRSFYQENTKEWIEETKTILSFHYRLWKHCKKSVDKKEVLALFRTEYIKVRRELFWKTRILYFIFFINPFWGTTINNFLQKNG